uniref:Uncharacterized protein n=1 Tax=Cucumis sativus TaxID=3659 RepID=A0A0A0KPR0_CUCSA
MFTFLPAEMVCFIILMNDISFWESPGIETLQKRYKVDAGGQCGQIFVQKLALQLFNGDNHQAAFRILSDFRKGKFGWTALERPPRSEFELLALTLVVQILKATLKLRNEIHDAYIAFDLRTCGKLKIGDLDHKW